MSGLCPADVPGLFPILVPGLLPMLLPGLIPPEVPGLADPGLADPGLLLEADEGLPSIQKNRKLIKYASRPLYYSKNANKGYTNSSRKHFVQIMQGNTSPFITESAFLSSIHNNQLSLNSCC